MFEPSLPDDLAKSNPLPCDADVAFEEEGHRYAIRVRNTGEWRTQGLLSVTGWIKRFVPNTKTDVFREAAVKQAAEINSLFGESYPAYMYDKVDRSDWEGALRCRSGESTYASEFASRFDAPGFVREPESPDADLKAKMIKWRSSFKKTAEVFTEVFGANEGRVLALPPNLIGPDVNAVWPRFGTRLHSDIEWWLNNGREPVYTGEFPEWQQFQSFVHGWFLPRGLVPFRTELTMSVATLGLCGQCDFVAKKSDGKHVLLDWKRSDKVRADGNDPFADRAGPMLGPWSHRRDTARNHYTIQLNLYRQFLMTYGIEVDEMYLVCFHRDFADYQLIEVDVIKCGLDTPDAKAMREMIDQRRREYIQYVFFIPGGDVARLAYDSESEEWWWMKPFETYVNSDDSPPKTGSATMKIQISVSGKEFRQRSTLLSEPIHVVSRDGAITETRNAVSRTFSQEHDRSIILSTRYTSASVAFGIHTYVLAPRGAKRKKQVGTELQLGPTKTWQWAAAALAPWSYAGYGKFKVESFMWSDVRMKTEGVSDAYESVLIQAKNHVYRSSTYVPPDLVQDVKLVMTEHVVPEFLELVGTGLPPDLVVKYGDDQNSVRFSTLNIHLEGLSFVNPEVDMDGDRLGPELMGSSAQSWYIWKTPVVTPSWLLARLSDVCWLHQYDYKTRYVKDVQAIVSGEPWSEANEVRYQRLLTDVVRIATMHATSSPYTEDIRYDRDGGAHPSDTYCSALTVPGDCEDGAHSAYMIYMSILFGKWDAKIHPADAAILRAMQQLAAYVGMPVCITGTSDNPMKIGQGGGTHAYGAVIPFPRFVRAVLGPGDHDEAYAAFNLRFGYECPENASDLDVSSIETTLFATPLLRYHARHPELETKMYDRMKRFAKNEMGEGHCASINFSFSYILNEDCACHLLAFKAFTSAHRELGILPRTLRGDPSSEYSCSFVFSRPAGGIGIERDELYKNALDWEMRVPHTVSLEVWEADARLIVNTRQPVVPLISRDTDPQKPHDVNAEVVKRHKDLFRYESPHLMVFVYDMGFVYPDGQTTLDKLETLQGVLRARTTTMGTYDKSVAVVYLDFQEEEEED